MTTMPLLGSNNRVSLRYIPEVTFAVTPNSGTCYELRHKGESLDFNLSKKPDGEIRSDRQIASTTTVDADASGSIKANIVYAEYDRFIAAALEDAWQVYGTNGVGATFTADFTATTITASAAPTGANAFTTLVKGQWFRLLAPTHANNGKLLRVSDTVAPTSTVITLHASTPLAVGSAVASCAVQTSLLTNGVSMTTFTIERFHTDLTLFTPYVGMTPNKMSVKFNNSDLSSLSFDFMGKSEGATVGVTAMPTAPTASMTYDPQNGVTGIGALWEAGAPLSNVFITEVSFDVENGLRGQKALANLGSVGLGQGDCMVKGTMSIYFSNAALVNKYLQDVYTSFTVATQDTAGNGYVFVFPRVMLSGAKRSAESGNQDCMLQVNWQAYADLSNATPALRKTVLIYRVGAAVTP